MSLWADGWFYVSAVGFAVSSVLFVLLLGQYRAAVEAEDQAEEEGPGRSQGEEPSAIPPKAEPMPKPRPLEAQRDKTLVLEPPEKKAPAPVVSPKIETIPSMLPAAEAAPEEPRKESPKAPAAGKTAPPILKTEATAPGGISPAILYLQGLKERMDRVDLELLDLKSLLSQQAAQGEEILRRLADLSGRLAAPVAVPEPVSASAPEEAREAFRQEAPPIVEAGTSQLEGPASVPPPQAGPGYSPAVVSSESTILLPPPRESPSEGLAAAEGHSGPSPSSETEKKEELRLTPPAVSEAAVPEAEEAGAGAQEEARPRKGPVWPI